VDLDACIALNLNPKPFELKTVGVHVYRVRLREIRSMRAPQPLQGQRYVKVGVAPRRFLFIGQ
jgi:hypothetical protein